MIVKHQASLKKKKKGKQLTNSILIKVRCCALSPWRTAGARERCPRAGAAPAGVAVCTPDMEPSASAPPGNGLAKPPRSARAT